MRHFYGIISNVLKDGEVNPDYIPETGVEGLFIFMSARHYCSGEASKYQNYASIINKCNMAAAVIVIVISLLNLSNIIESFRPFVVYIIYLAFTIPAQTKYAKESELWSNMAKEINDISSTLHTTNSLIVPIKEYGLAYEVLEVMLEEDKENGFYEN